MFEKTNRNTIVYYSGWLQKPRVIRSGLTLEIDDADKNGFMAAIHQMDRSLGLDLILHTPGGDIAATESLVDYLRAMFKNDIRAIVPQLAMSAGTMIALSCKEILMGKHSSLGPIDPQIAGVPAHGILEEFRTAQTDVAQNPMLAPLWQVVIAKYSPTLIGEAQKAIDWSNTLVTEWLKTGMFDGDPKAEEKADKIVKELASHALTLSHARHISIKRALELDLNVTGLEDDNDLQDAVLAVHHACVHTLQATAAFKLIENHRGIAYIQTAAMSLTAQGLA